MLSHLPGALQPAVLLFSLVLTFLCALPAVGQHSAALRVLVTAPDGRPLHGAQVVIEGTGIGRITNAEGVALLHDLAPGARAIRVSLLGYEPETTRVQLLPDRSVSTHFNLAVRPIALAGVTVRAVRSRVLTASGFYQRQDDGFGSFLTRDQIQRRSPHVVSDLLRTVAGVRLRESRSGDQYASMGRSTGTRCPIQYYLDGIPAPMLNIDSLLPSDIEGIEIYRGPSQVPPRFRGRGGMCGVIVIWTRIS